MKWRNSGDVRVFENFMDNVIVLHEDKDRLSRLDLQSKLEERFSQREIKDLPKLCSENSEDALTWSAFRTLSKRGDPSVWFPLFWEASFRQNLPSSLSPLLKDLDVRFWQPFNPPPTRPHREGNTEVDVVIAIGREALVFVEVKLFSPFSDGTTYDPERDQIIRNIDVGTHHAKREGYRSFHLVLLTATRSNKCPERKLIDHYRGKPSAIASALSYRKDLTARDLEDIARSIGWIAWPDILKILLRTLLK